MGSAALAQAQLLGQIPLALKDMLGDWTTEAQVALQFNRSTPGLTTILVGMGSAHHVEENLAVARAPSLAPEEFFALFGG